LVKGRRKGDEHPPKLFMGYGTLYLYLFRWQIFGEMFYSDAGGIRR